ncbi:MAG: Gfo/Idh/MocA family oxidoreductase [Gemmatimonadaceae bacterium]|nr:Gfo/Idh/MocA family oxidoreductase [Gemmatimonadaceae bacterium]
MRILRDLPGIRFAGFFEANAARASAVATELGVIAHATLDALLAEVDAVTCVVPTLLHHAVGMQVLRAGKHLFIEKPIAATLEEADALVAEAEARGLVLQVGHVERFNRAIRAALPYIDRPLFVQSDRLAPYTPRGADVAVVLDLMIHDIDLVASLVGSPVTDVTAVGVPVITETPDIANARLTFASGAVATITASRVSRERQRKLRIFQKSGYLTMDLGTGQGMFYRLRDDVDPRTLAERATSIEEFVQPVFLVAPEGDALALEFASFAAAVRGEGSVVVSGADGRAALATALRIVADIDAQVRQVLGGDAGRA